MEEATKPVKKASKASSILPVLGKERKKNTKKIFIVVVYLSYVFDSWQNAQF